MNPELKNSIEELRHLLKSLPAQSDKGRDERIRRAKSDFRFFVSTYLPHHIGFCEKETSIFRHFVYKELSEICNTNRKIEIKAYRGSAKTTLITRAFLLWELLCGEKCYALIISSTIDIAKESIATIALELEENSNLIADFNIANGSVWSSEELIFSVDSQYCKIKAFGAQKRIRGTNFLSRRPDLIVCDDIENDENVESKTQRDKLERWFKRAILKLPARNDTKYNIIVVGTMLHHDSLLARLGARGDFFTKNFPLVVEFPERLDEITKENLSKTLLKGIKLDDSALDSMDVMRDFLEDKESFYSEFQNQPISEDGLVFGEYKTFSHWVACDAYYIGIDPALGKKKGDFFALTLLGYLQKEQRFLAQSFGYKIAPTKMIEIILDLYARVASYEKPLKIAIETIAFQEFFKDALKERAKNRGIVLSVVELKNSVAKELRIDSLAPFIADGTISIFSESHLLIEELCTYPKAAHDDLLDSLEMAFRIASRKGTLDYQALERVSKRFNIKQRNPLE
ncbi:MAG: phage terminase large subunit [Wolinella sp.]